MKKHISYGKPLSRNEMKMIAGGGNSLRLVCGDVGGACMRWCAPVVHRPQIPCPDKQYCCILVN